MKEGSFLGLGLWIKSEDTRKASWRRRHSQQECKDLTLSLRGECNGCRGIKVKSREYFSLKNYKSDYFPLYSAKSSSRLDNYVGVFQEKEVKRKFQAERTAGEKVQR